MTPTIWVRWPTPPRWGRDHTFWHLVRDGDHLTACGLVIKEGAARRHDRPATATDCCSWCRGYDDRWGGAS